MAKGITLTETKERFEVDNDGVITGSSKTVELKSVRAKTEKEENYIKVYKYTNTLFAFKGIPLSLVPIVIEISKYMTFAEYGQTVALNKFIKQQICDSLGIGADRLKQAIKQLADNDVLRRTTCRGMYAVNPFICACGDAMKIKELQARFDFDADLMKVSRIENNLITGSIVKRVINEEKRKMLDKNIPGQMSLEDYMGEQQ